MKATIFDIERNSYVDGPGIRTTVFFKGCNLRCAWCHNPESQSALPQMMFYKNKCTGCGKCKEKCPNHLESCELCGKCTIYCPHDAREICGKEYTVDEVMREILKDKVFYENSGGGVTFSGGECMLQIDFLEEILKACKQNGIHTAVDTAGNVPFECFERILPFTDLFLYDVKCFDSEKHKRYTGAANELILSNLEKLLKTGRSVWVRIPIIPSVNDDEKELQHIRAFLRSCKYPEKVELLPYHAMGEHKYAAIGKEVKMFSVPSEEKMSKLKKIFL
ncbi:MAG: glycyl-radical enzyme activating protein [Ruminococcaceae bacterium]|nr:glycyl-radical enzyme activating protein [Oscillospiraceae bacterium]